MLSPNTLLNKARYRVDQLHIGGSKWNVYAGTDQTIGATVLIVEHGSTEPTFFAEHKGLVKFTDIFITNGRRYDVTEPVELRPTGGVPTAQRWDEFANVLMAVNAIHSTTNRCELSTQTMVVTAGDVTKLLPIEAADSMVEIEAWHVPIERIWRELDHISQKAIYNGWDEAGIADLERPLDESSDVYTVAAVYYQILTGTTPPSAFERTVVSLDESDPLIDPTVLKSDLGQAGAHLLRCLELKRDKRFGSLEEAVMSLPTLAMPEKRAISEFDDELEVLELGFVAPDQARATTRQQVIAKVDIVPTVKYATPPSQSIEASPTLEPPRPSATEPVDKDRLSAFPDSAEAVAHETVIEPVIEKEFSSAVFSVEEAPRRGSMMKFVIAAAALVAVSGIGWGIFQYSGSDAVAAPSAASAQIGSQINRHESSPTPLPAVDEPQPTQTSLEVSSDPAQSSYASKADPSRTRPQIATKATPKPASAPDAKAKKKVTVDDLINDN